MMISATESKITISGTGFSPVHTLECGQCFRFSADETGLYTGVAMGKAVSLSATAEGEVTFFCARQDFDSLWKHYFDLELDYDAITDALPRDPFTAAAIDYGRGLRILRQEPWEALCSFIISQCNNISRIKTIVDRLCQNWGQPLQHRGTTLYTFPTPEAIAALEVGDLDCLRAGYRAKYLISAARQVAAGNVDFESLRAMPAQRARGEIMKLEGVGGKVADCFLLFGLGKLDSFPVDTWMKKAAAFYPGGFPAFGEYAGIAQQYIFYYARSTKINSGLDIPRR